MSNATSIATLKTAHTAAETGGVTFNTGATVAPLGNSTTWSRASARSAYASGAISQGRPLAGDPAGQKRETLNAEAGRSERPAA